MDKKLISFTWGLNSPWQLDGPDQKILKKRLSHQDPNTTTLSHLRLSFFPDNQTHP